MSIGDDYNKLAKDYDYLLIDVVGYLDPQEILDEIKGTLNLDSSTKIIDFGCGTGLVG